MFRIILIMILFVFADKALTDEYHGVCIGINKYESWCNNLFFAVADAQEMVAALENELYWESSNILLLTDEAATKQDILNAISTINLDDIEQSSLAVTELLGEIVAICQKL